MNKLTGVTVPLSALYTKECAAAGDFPALKPFADFCQKCGLGVIQLLPVNDTGTHSSPYSGLSAYALHPMYIRIEALPEFQEALENDRAFAASYKKFTKEFKYRERFDYTKYTNAKTETLHILYSYIEKKLAGKVKKTAAKPASAKTAAAEASIDDVSKPKQNFAESFIVDLGHFARKNPWIIEYAVFKNLKDAAMQASWKDWSENLANMTREQIKLRWNNKALKSSHNFFVWCQMRAAEQFKDAADYVKEKGIILKGDIPILMNEDSSDCWAHGEYFNQELRAGSPPDGDNPEGQNWGFPTYRWDKLEADDYSWWKERVKLASNYYGAFRIDHILGFFRIWATSQKDTSAYLGHTMPCATFNTIDLMNAGFDEGRIHWLSEPHVPTRLIEDITWNHDEAVEVLSKVCDRLGQEELWNFKKSISGDREIYEMKFFDDEQKDLNVKNALSKKWKDRTIIASDEFEFKESMFSKEELEKISPAMLPEKVQTFMKVYTHEQSTAWKTLSDSEKDSLQKLFAAVSEKEDELWKQQALKVLEPIVKETEMIPCAEDLGVSLKCMDEVLSKMDILSLKVVRWCRDWFTQNQPYVPFEKYPERSVATTSVHDSSTLRQWWNTEKQSVQEFLKLCTEEEINTVFEKTSDKKDELIDTQKTLEEKICDIAARPFTQTTAELVLVKSASCASRWFINPLQDFLYLDNGCYLENADMERINIPGSVSDFNWTYRIPKTVEELSGNSLLIEKIKAVAAAHNGE